MAKITNLSREPLDFITSIKDGVAATETLRPGEERDIKTDVEHAQFKGRLQAGLISVAEPKAKPAPAA